MYSAKVMGGETGQMTVAMYQGARVEEVSSHSSLWDVFFSMATINTLQEWRQHLTIYELLR
jgi:hypothetical protein